MLGKKPINRMTRPQVRKQIQRLKSKDTLTDTQSARLSKLQTSWNKKAPPPPPPPPAGVFVPPPDDTPADTITPLAAGWYDGRYWTGADWMTPPSGSAPPADTGVFAPGGGSGSPGGGWSSWLDQGELDSTAGGEYADVFAPGGSAPMSPIDQALASSTPGAEGGSSKGLLIAGAVVVALLLFRKKRRSA